ncbi:MAG: hypothetical protein WC516_05410 [Patescibacteria group bacterium]|jgi:hypothetical protein
MVTKEKIDDFFKGFVQDGPQKFYDSVVAIGTVWRSQPAATCLVEESLLQHSYEALKRAREIEQQTDGSKADDWRLMSFLLRKAAHKLFRSFNSESTHLGFFRLVK